MENNRQSGPAFAVPYYPAQGLFAPSSFLTSRLNGVLDVIVAVIGRISLSPETG
jgi:hypothetical protein